MSFEIKRKQRETFESMLRRFSKRMIQSGKLIQVKKSQHHEKEQSKNLKKRSALHRMKTRVEKDYLRKTGQLKEDDYKSKFFKR